MQDLGLPPLPTKLPDPTQLPPVPNLPLPPKDFTIRRPVPREQEPSTPPPGPITPDDDARHTDNFGWLKNLPKSTFDMTKSVVYDLPKAALTAAVTYARDPEQYQKDLSLVFAKNNGLGKMFRDQMTDYYTNDFWHNFNEDPARFLTDIAAVASLGGGTLAKAGELGRVAEVANIGKKIAQVGHYADPLTWVGKGASRAAAPIMEGLGFGKYSANLADIRAVLAANQSIDMNSEIAKHVFGNLNAADNQRLLRLLRWGERGEIAAAESVNDVVGQRLKLWKDAITGGDEPLFKDLHLLDDKSAREANAVKMSEYSQTHHKELGLERPITPKEGLAMIEQGTHNPTFMSSYRMKAQAQDLFEAMNKASYRGGFWARFERAIGGGTNLVEDVNEIQARQIASKHDALYKVKLARAVDALMAEKGERLFIPKDSGIAVPKGYAPLQGPFYEKYWSDVGRTGSNSADILRKFISEGKTPQEALAAARLAAENDPKLMATLSNTGDVYVPKHVAAWMNRELAPISPLGRIYDSTLARFKGLATVFNPRFWGSVIFGNSILGLVYGISPDYARIAYKYRDFLPPELRTVGRAEYFLAQRGIYSRVANNLGDFAQKLDNMFRLPMFAQELAKDSHVRMQVAGGNFFLSKDQIINAVKYYGGAQDRLMNTRLMINKLNSEIAAGFKDVNVTARKQEFLGQAVSRAASREGTGVAAEGYDILGNKIQAEIPAYPKESPAVGGHPGPKTGVQYDDQGNVVKSHKTIQDPIYGEVSTKPIKPPKTSAGDEAKQIDVNLETGLKNPEFAEPGTERVPSPPQNLELDELTGLRVDRQPELYGGHEPGKPLTPRQEAIVRATDKYGNIGEALKSKQEDVIHKLAEIGELQKRIPGLAQDAEVANRAIEVGNRFYGSYLRLSPFERKSLRRLLPFYTFNKAMTMLAFRFPFLYPQRAFIGSHLAQAWNDIMADENSYLPARLRDYVPVMAREDGSVIGISSGMINPLSSAKVGDFAELPLPSVFNPLKSNPVIALVLKMNGAIPEWSGKPLSPGEYATRLDNGTVVQWTGKGFKTVIAQPSVFKSLADLFPQSQLMDRLVHPFAQSDRGWLFNPDPILGPDGKPRYPKELVDLVLSNIIPTSTYNLDEVKTQERGRMNAVMKSYEKDLRFATPVRREQILEILRGWANEKNRKWVQ